MKKALLTFALLSITIGSQHAHAITLKGTAPSSASLSSAKSDEGNWHIAATSSLDLHPEGSSLRLWFNEDNKTNEVIFAVVKTVTRNGQRRKKVIPMEQAESKGLCGKRKVKGAVVLKSDISDGLRAQFEMRYDGEGVPTHAILTEITGRTDSLKKTLKSRISRSRSELVELNSDCSRADGNGL
ncbi:MAG: hypothetical protein KDD55_09925 [Bdellovibrionales bacterium]|nr:hypothetical protein [Bdellovibrionales bacterium]